MSLAHNGVLFLDELPEFPKQALEALRQPMESGRTTVSRAALRRRSGRQDDDYAVCCSPKASSISKRIV